MDKLAISDVLAHFRSYSYAAKMVEPYLKDAEPIYSERQFDTNKWDATRYNRIIGAVSGAIDEVLTDEQADIIRHRYLDKNPRTFESIAELIDREVKTVRKRHGEALRSLEIALSTFVVSTEITPFEHMFEPKK